MRGPPAQHRVLLRSLSGLDARDPSLIDTSVSVNSIPVVGPLISPLVGGGGGGTQPPTSPGSPSGNPPPGSTPTPNGGGNNGQSNGNAPPPANPPLSKSVGDQNGPLVSIVLSLNTPPTPTPGSPSSSSNAHSASGAVTTASSLSTGGGGNYVASNGQNTSGFAGATPSSSNTNSTPGASSAAVATNVLAPSQSSPGSGSDIVSAPASPTTSTAGATSSGERLSGGTIAGITIACLVSLLILVLLLVRRRAIARRVELRDQWWFNRTSGRNSSLLSQPRSPVRVNSDPSSSRLSAASSFATNFDQGLMFRVESPSRLSLGVLPDLPPTAEVRERNSVLIYTEGVVSQRASMLNGDNDEGAQYLAVSPGQGSLESFTPMSVRPFSPSESFFFPKPPAPHPPDPMSSRSSATTLVQVSTPPRAFMTDLPPASAPIPFLQSHTLIPATTFSPPVATINSPDPFADPVKPEFMGVEIVCRPFVRSLEDELVVYRGDRIRIFQTFDDGWAFVEKLAGTQGEHAERGLIPVDCLHEGDPSLSTPLARKRVSYGSDQLVGYAL